MKFNKAACKAVQLDPPGTPKHTQRMGNEQIKKFWAVVVNEKFNKSQQHILAAQTVNYILGCNKKKVIRRAREDILLLNFAPMRFHLQ